MKDGKKDYLAEAFDEISDIHIMEAASYRKKQKIVSVKRWLALAACFAVLACAAFGWNRFYNGKRSEDDFILQESDSKDDADRDKELTAGQENEEDKETEGVQDRTDVIAGEEKEDIQGDSAEKPENTEAFLGIVYPEYVSYSEDDWEDWKRLLEDNCISEEFSKALERFAMVSGSSVLSGTKENVNYSPLSLYYALALVGCGAEGETADEILDILGMSDQAELSEQCRKLYQYFYYSELRNQAYDAGSEEAYQDVIQLGNSLWISKKLEVKETYRNMVLERFFAQSYQVDFQSADAGSLMSKWISEHTKGVLEPELSLDSETLLSIINTLYFYGSWTEKFSQALTETDRFTLADGSQTEWDFMNSDDTAGRFQKGEGFTVSYLDTSNNCRMVFLLPDEGYTVEEFTRSPELLQQALDFDSREWQSGQVIWKIPKFAFGSSFALADTLKNLGVERMFREDGEFSLISEQPLKITQVIQETHIGIDEQGVEGAAYTGIDLAVGMLVDESQKAEMILNRPFLYGIQENDSGAWLFLGVCQNPAAE